MGKRPWGSINLMKSTPAYLWSRFPKFQTNYFCSVYFFFQSLVLFYSGASLSATLHHCWRSANLVFFYAKQQNWCLVFALKTKTTTKQTKYSTICGAWYNLHNNNWYSKISLHGFQNLWKKCAIFLFNKPSHLIENWW